MDTTTQATCEERIDDYLKRFEESAGELVEDYNSGDDERFSNWNEYPLSVETRKITKVLMSWGGPSDFLKIEHEGTDIYSIEYHFQDWFDGAMRLITDEESNIWQYAQTIIDAREDI